jgi:Mrp family chromosome partitioning ATPase
MWRIPIDIFLSHSEDNLSADWVRAALRELRLDFDYTLFHGPPAGQYSETALLGQLTDGVVLVLEANSTRRVAAQKAIQKLHAGNARLLGTVLNNRTFPIPERIYRKL